MPPRSKKDRLFGAACLRLKTPPLSTGEGIYQSVLRDLKLTEAEVDRYLEKHRDAVEAALESGQRQKR